MCYTIVGAVIVGLIIFIIYRLGLGKKKTSKAVRAELLSRDEKSVKVLKYGEDKVYFDLLDDEQFDALGQETKKIAEKYSVKDSFKRIK